MKKKIKIKLAFKYFFLISRNPLRKYLFKKRWENSSLHCIRFKRERSHRRRWVFPIEKERKDKRDKIFFFFIFGSEKMKNFIFLPYSTFIHFLPHDTHSRSLSPLDFARGGKNINSSLTVEEIKVAFVDEKKKRDSR